jgi:NAD(P)-dependent dehydrogenase (short-subunit alcohol dehydrogenase family)
MPYHAGYESPLYFGGTYLSLWRARSVGNPPRQVLPPEEIGDMVAYLAGPNARHITAQSINIDSGLSVY